MSIISILSYLFAEMGPRKQHSKSRNVCFTPRELSLPCPIDIFLMTLIAYSELCERVFTVTFDGSIMFSNNELEDVGMVYPHYFRTNEQTTKLRDGIPSLRK